MVKRWSVIIIYSVDRLITSACGELEQNKCYYRRRTRFALISSRTLVKLRQPPSGTTRQNLAADLVGVKLSRFAFIAAN